MISESYQVVSGKTAEIGSSGVRSQANAERIVGVAIRLPFDPDVAGAKWIFAAAPAPARHHHILRQLHRLNEGRLDKGQGFVTDTGRYVDREEAWQIAKAAGQLNDRAPTDGRGGTLYSEDVW